MSNIEDFIRARLDEDEQIAADCEWKNWRCSGREVVALASPVMRPVADGKFRGQYGADPLAEADAEHMARHDPARVLVDVAAKRATLDWLNHFTDEDDDEWFVTKHVLEFMALPYANHSDYDETWRPA